MPTRTRGYDHATVNHFIDMTDGANTRGVTLANSDCAFARLGRSTVTTLDTTTRRRSTSWRAGKWTVRGWEFAARTAPPRSSSGLPSARTPLTIR